MPNYLLAYHGGGMPEAEAEQARVLAAWNKWYGNLGPKVVDGGNPVGMTKTVKSDRSVMEGGGASPVSGYTIITADDINLAIDLTKDCPIIEGGGSVAVCETFAAM
jgi:hypothetical protein